MLFGKLFTNPKMWVNGNANDITMGGVYTCKDVQNVPTGDGALFVFKAEDTVKQVFVPVGEEGVVYTRVIGEEWGRVTGTSEETNELIQNAIDTAVQAQNIVETLDTKLNNIIIESGTSDAETVAARTNTNTETTYATLGTRLDTENNRIKKSLNDLSYVEGDNLISVSDITASTQVSVDNDTETGEITVSTVANGPYRCAQTSLNFIRNKLTVGKTYRIHVKCQKISGNPVIKLAIRGTSNNEDGVAKSVELANNDENFFDFTVNADMKRVTLFVTMGTSASASVKFSDLWLKENTQTQVNNITGEVDLVKDNISALQTSVKMGVFGYSSYLGNAITLQFNDGTVMMIDSFSANAWNNVKSDLTLRGIAHLDYFMLTHWHGDHSGNISNLITDGYIDENTTVFLPQNLNVDATGSLPNDWTAVVNNYNSVLPLITALNGTIIYPTEGQEVSIGGCKLRFWNTDHSVFYPGGTYASTNYNDWSLGAYLFIGNTNVCFTADIGPIGQKKMVDLNTMVKANLYTATHHGWDNGNAANYFGLLPEWINRLNPDIVLSEDYSIHNDYILTPNSPMQSWCERNCVPNYRTAINGTMSINLTPNGWSFDGAYSKYIREYDWGFDYHKKRLLARIDALKTNLLKDRYAATTDTYSFDRLLTYAVTALRGESYLNGYKYSFYIRVFDSDNADAYLEIIASNFQYRVTGAVITTRYSNVIRYNQGNSQGTMTVAGRTGTLTAIVELISYEEVTG